jgi:hypothetical protein
MLLFDVGLLILEFLCSFFSDLFQTGSMEEVPLRINADERDFEMDESDFLLQPPDHEIRSSASRYRSSKRCARCLPLLLCGYVSFICF